MSYESDDSSDGEPITHPTQVYQRIYEKEADSHLQERFALEREADAAEKEYLKVADEWKKKPTPNLEQRMNDLSERCEEINENLNDANESWINSYSVAMYYKDKERRELEEDSD